MEENIPDRIHMDKLRVCLGNHGQFGMNVELGEGWKWEEMGVS